MKFFTIFLILMVTLFASRKHYLVELEDKNEIIDENEKNVLNHEENVLNHEEKNAQQNKAFLLTHYCEHYPETMACSFMRDVDVDAPLM